MFSQGFLLSPSSAWDTPCIAAGPAETAEISLHLFSKKTLCWCPGLQKHLNKVWAHGSFCAQRADGPHWRWILGAAFHILLLGCCPVLAEKYKAYAHTSALEDKKRVRYPGRHGLVKIQSWEEKGQPPLLGLRLRWDTTWGQGQPKGGTLPFKS